MPMTAKEFTVFRRTKVGLLDDDGNKMGSTVEETVHHVPSRDAETAVEDLISAFADDDESLNDIEPDDDEYDSLHAMAMDDLDGEFAAYEGRLTERPETPPLHEDGEMADPTCYRRLRDGEGVAHPGAVDAIAKSRKVFIQDE